MEVICEDVNISANNSIVVEMDKMNNSVSINDKAC